MDMRNQIFEDFVNSAPDLHYSPLEIAGSFATMLTLLVVALVVLVGGVLSIGAAGAFAVTWEKRFLPMVLAPQILGWPLYGVLLAGGLTSLGLWCGVALLALSYPILRRVALRRAKRKLEASS